MMMAIYYNRVAQGGHGGTSVALEPMVAQGAHGGANKWRPAMTTLPMAVVMFFLGRRRCPGTPAAPQSIHILTMCKSQFIKLRYEPTGRLFGRSFVDVSVFTHTCMSMLLLQNESRWSE